MRFRQTLSGIGDIEVDKADLLAILEQNKVSHHEVFLAAVEKFRVRATDGLEQLIGTVRSGKLPESLVVALPIPEEHTDDYDRNIRMLRMHKHDTIVLTEEAYLRLVDDKWDWTNAFASNTSSYLVQ